MERLQNRQAETLSSEQSQPEQQRKQGRRQLLGWLGAGLAAPLLGGCAAATGPRPSTSPALPGGASGPTLELLYFADTLDRREPSRAWLPDINLGPATRLGSAPWLTGNSAPAQLSAAAGTSFALLDATSNPASVAAPSGGYAALAALLASLRQQHPQALTLENGQCWNGSGLAHLTRGRSGVDGSRLLGAEVRVSSDERLLWPEQTAALYRDAALPVLGATLDSARQQALGVSGWTLFRRAGVRVAVVGATDPHASDEQGSLKEWYERLASSVQQARREADLLILLADVGTGPALWLAERLDGVDLILAARGQDLWPQLLSPRNPQGVPVAVCLPGCRGLGAFSIQARAQAGGWQFEARFIAADEATLSTEAQALLPALRQQLQQQRAPHAAWLDQPLARAPALLWRRDLFGGGWDRLIHQALAEGFDGEVVLPGLRYDLPLAPGEWITRDHLFALTGSYPAPVQTLDASVENLTELLEQRADEAFSEPLLLDTSRDLPRLLAADYRLSYVAARGQRIDALQMDSGRRHFSARTFALQATEGTPLWQHLERYLRAQPLDWQLGALRRPQVAFVEGHPGWHPRVLHSRALSEAADLPAGEA